MRAPLGAFALLAAAAAIAALFVGGSALPPAEVLAALAGGHGDASVIVLSLRLPRLCSAALVGAALGAAGFLLQGLVRNPLVDPFLTGISAGAAAAVAVAVALGASAVLLPPIGFAAGLGAALAVAALARRRGSLDAERLILAGVSLSALFSAVVALALTRLPNGGGSDTILAWLAGSLAGRGWADILWTLPYLLAGATLAYASARPLNAMRLGNGAAAAVGIDVPRASWLILGAATLLTAAAVSLSGVVGFVGLIVPHVARRLCGTDARAALPGCALLGAALVLAADAFSRAIAPPAEIPLGVVLALVGVPAFLYLYARPGNAERLWGT